MTVSISDFTKLHRTLTSLMANMCDKPFALFMHAPSLHSRKHASTCFRHHAPFCFVLRRWKPGKPLRLCAPAVLVLKVALCTTCVITTACPNCAQVLWSAMESLIACNGCHPNVVQDKLVKFRLLRSACSLRLQLRPPRKSPHHCLQAASRTIHHTSPI